MCIFYCCVKRVEYEDSSDNAQKLGKAARSGAQKGVRISGDGIISVVKRTGQLKSMEGRGIFDSVSKGVNKAVDTVKNIGKSSSKSWSKGLKAIASTASDAADEVAAAGKSGQERLLRARADGGSVTS